LKCTSHDGKPIWINTARIESFQESQGTDTKFAQHHTEISVSDERSIYVRNSVEEIQAALYEVETIQHVKLASPGEAA
jgi:hypothetical protein